MVYNELKQTGKEKKLKKMVPLSSPQSRNRQRLRVHHFIPCQSRTSRGQRPCETQDKGKESSIRQREELEKWRGQR